MINHDLLQKNDENHHLKKLEYHLCFSARINIFLDVLNELVMIV